MIKILTLVFLSSTAVWATPHEEAEVALAKIGHSDNEITRLDNASRLFLGRPYDHAGPLGESPTGRYDQDPLYRFDAFDCTTFVETMVSLSLSANVAEFEDQMNEIRYDHAQIDFLKRNHFPSINWIPNNIANGVLKEINHTVLPKSQLKISKTLINLPGWLKKIGTADIQIPMISLSEKRALAIELNDLSSSYQPVVAHLEYIAISTLLARPLLLKKIPNGTLINFVRPNWDLDATTGTHQDVSHQGFLFWKAGVLHLRHASPNGSSVVTEESFLSYIKKYENHPTLKGVHLMALNLDDTNH